jgi:hypothetical protein
MITRVASQPRRWDVPAGTRVPSSRTDWPLHDQRADLRLQPPAQDHHAVVIVIHVQGPALVPLGRFPGLGLPVDLPPAPHDPFDVFGRPGPPDGQQPLFGLRGGDACQGADLRVRQLSACERLGQQRQRS